MNMYDLLKGINKRHCDLEKGILKVLEEEGNKLKGRIVDEEDLGGNIFIYDREIYKKYIQDMKEEIRKELVSNKYNEEKLSKFFKGRLRIIESRLKIVEDVGKIGTNINTLENILQDILTDLKVCEIG